MISFQRACFAEVPCQAHTRLLLNDTLNDGLSAACCRCSIQCITYPPVKSDCVTNDLPTIAGVYDAVTARCWQCLSWHSVAGV